MNIITLEETASTNTALRAMPDAPHATVVAARRQTAGRGQRGNTWESEPEKNLTFSILVRPLGIPPVRQMAISRAVSLAIVRWLDSYLPEGEEASIKWPNDIYVGDRKICGILIEHVLSSGRIDRTVIGAGINVNQALFRSDAPNPVSLTQLTGRTYPLDAMLEEVTRDIVDLVEAEDCAAGTLTERDYMERLWRREGFHPYRDAAGCFDAAIDSVAPDGTLTLRRLDGTVSAYAFKEVAAIIEDRK